MPSNWFYPRDERSDWRVSRYDKENYPCQEEQICDVTSCVQMSMAMMHKPQRRSTRCKLLDVMISIPHVFSRILVILHTCEPKRRQLLALEAQWLEEGYVI